MPHLNAPSALAVRTVADRLGSLCPEVVFVGGAVVPLLSTDSAALDFRPTDDVDLVTHVVSWREHAAFEAALRVQGFTHDTTPGAPLCRWRVGGLVVDAVPHVPEAIGFSNRWYPAALETSWDLPFPGGPTARIVSAPVFFATKWEAFQDRGGGTDYVGSHDLEDLLTVLDARAESVSEVKLAPPPVRAGVAQAFAKLIATGRFVDGLPGLVEPGHGTVVLDRLRRIAALG